MAGRRQSPCDHTREYHAKVQIPEKLNWGRPNPQQEAEGIIVNLGFGFLLNKKRKMSPLRIVNYKTILMHV